MANSAALPCGPGGRTRRSTAGWPTPPSWSSTAGSNPSGRGPTLPSDAGETSEVHDLGDVSLLPGFVETHIHMHFPSPLDYREIARPEPVERMLIRATGAHARPPAVRGDDRARHGQPRRRRAGDPVGDPRRRHRRRAAPARRRGADHHDRRPLLVPRRRSRHDRGGRPRGCASAGRLDVDCVKIMASGGGYTPTSNPRSQQYGLETLRAAVDEAHRLGLPVLAHSLTAVSNRMCAEAGVDTIIHGGVWWTDYPVRDRAYDYDPAVADLIAATRDLGRPDDRRGRAPPRASRGRACRQARVRALGAARRARASSSRGSTSCATWPNAASGSSAGWGWACRSSTSTRSPAAPRSTRACSASSRGGRSRRSPPTRPRRSGWPGRPARSGPGWRPTSSPSRATRSRTCPALRRVRDVVQGGRLVVRDGRRAGLRRAP